MLQQVTIENKNNNINHEFCDRDPDESSNFNSNIKIQKYFNKSIV